MNETQEREYETWHAVCQEATELGIDVNTKGNALVQAIRRWGEELGELTLEDPKAHARRLESCRKRYPFAREQAVKFRNDRLPTKTGLDGTIETLVRKQAARIAADKTETKGGA